MRKALSISYLFGASFWLLSVQYYVVQLVVAAQFRGGYSWANNTISDLANTHCGSYGARFVCSPLHPVMNSSFIILGLTMIGGAGLLARTLSSNLITRLGFGCMALAGAGTILVGLFPENTVSALHVSGAALAFIFGNIGMIVLAYSLKSLPALFRLVTVIAASIALLALILFQQQMYLGLGIGGLERIVSYPQSIWMTIFGAYLLLHRSSITSIPAKT